MSPQVPIHISVEKKGIVAVLTMSGSQNRINMIFCDKWMEALDKVESWPDVKALVTTGSGKFYSNGLDLEYLMGISQEEFAEYGKRFMELRKRLLCFPMVTVAAINGHCFAGGVIFALLHDYCVMQNGKGWMCLNEVDLGMQMPPFVQVLLKTKFSPSQIRDAVIYGRRYTASEALEFGLIDKVANEGQAVQASVDMARSLVEKRTYARQMVHDMKSDLYSHILTVDEHSRPSPTTEQKSRL
uniref:enoyl-CoA delta isomerase 3-like n=1 Tax=Styela clava TaxID=7725 RepID=UPI001939B946|nr:enoyl-CoA delta isomerase 3-like [Styela clava]